MSRFLCFLGVCGLLAGASLMLPGVASAAIATCGGSSPNFSIAEIPGFLFSPEKYECTMSPGPSSSVNVDLIQGGLVSDNVQISTGGLVTLVSDGESGMPATSGAGQTQEVTVACPAGFGPENEPGGETTCNGATLSLRFASGNGSLTVYSDIGTVPEPSTGLLLGAALPALLGIRRRSIRVRA